MFSSPIPRAVQPRYNEGANVGAVSVRDDRANSKQWQKNRIVGNQMRQDGSAFALLQRRVAQLRKSKTGYLESTPTLQPFSIYAIGNGFQIRDGIIGYRSKYFIYTAPASYGGTKIDAGGAYEIPIYCPNTDPNTDNVGFNGVNFSRQPVLNTATVTLDAGGLKTLIPVSTNILMPNTFPANGIAIFWVELADDNVNGVTVKLYGKMTNYNTGGVEFPFYPQGENVFPIGYLNIFNGAISIQQYQVGNLTNRYLPGTVGGSSPLNYRGRWTADNLHGQAFYDGDIVVDDVFDFTQVISGGAGLTFPYQKAFVYYGGANLESLPPSSNLPVWKYLYPSLIEY